MKTISAWLKKLPDPHRTQALANLKSRDKNKVIAKTKVEKLSNAVQSAFIWNTTPEGHVYWENLIINIELQEYERKNSKRS